MKPLVSKTDLFGAAVPAKVSGALQSRFIVPPFTVLDTKQGYWQARKREWIALGIRGEEGRADIAGANNICSEEWGRGHKAEQFGVCFGSGAPGELGASLKARTEAEVVDA